MVSRTSPLEDLKPTFNYMLRAILAQQHPDGYIQGDRNPDTTQYSQDTLSLTNYFIAAVRACGYHRGRYIDGTLKWILSTLPETVEVLDKNSLNQLEILLQTGVTSRNSKRTGWLPTTSSRWSTRCSSSGSARPTTRSSP